ncbi:hypothetical protein M9194_12750 [Vibrio sp. S4M6]|uniref:hypothetical protein n=1 Tax=Vibrio sinus TaxID=2946865 RepID=UPI002029F459|nr:hypothetical protein [Vibrio sinus]MCL9782296.1 hypothetical protein [Vibrio sinus]
MLNRILLLATVGIILTGCVQLNTVSLTSVPAQRGQQIAASASDWNFIGINFNNDIVNEAVANLKKQCPKGNIEGVLTKHQTTGYVLFFKREIIATGYCNKASL